ncbi:hypothetical protein [Actinomyces vulturis]|uniref:hypothetical protein n=1 Tax=Actinomyces vulturis TaxID=1857645 RepID=UPI00082B5ED8|nr:hypothetical protein [Actinomyces vulturis]
MNAHADETAPSPTQETNLVVDFCGEIYTVNPQDTFVIGRGGDLDVDDNPYLHRRFLVLSNHDSLWWISNEGSRISATLTDGEALVQSRLAPGASMPLVFPRVVLTFSAGPTTYEVDLMPSGAHFTSVEGGSMPTGTATIGVSPLTRTQFLLVLALAEPVLKRVGTGTAAIPSSAQAAERLGWPLTTFNRKLDAVCDKLDRSGVKGLRGGRGGAALNRRTALVEHAVSTLMVTADDLHLLDDEAKARRDLAQ